MTKLEKIYELIQKYNIDCSLNNYKYEKEIILYGNESHELIIYEQDGVICVLNSYDSDGKLDDFIAKFDGELDRVNNYLSSYDDFKNVNEIFERISQEQHEDLLGYSDLVDDLQYYVERYYGYKVEYGALLIDTLNDDYTKYKHDAAYEAIKDIQEIFSPCKKELLDILNEKDDEISQYYRIYQSTRVITTVKKYKDGSLRFSKSSNGEYTYMRERNMVDCWFLSKKDAEKAIEFIGSGIIRKARKIPNEFFEIEVNGIPVIIDADDETSQVIFNAFIKSASEGVDESFIYEKLENNNKLKLQDTSTKDATHITVKRYKDNEQLFDIKQETDEDDLHFYVRIDNGKETFEYSRKIETQQDFIKALEQTISALENYNEFSSYRDDLIDVLDEFK